LSVDLYDDLARTVQELGVATSFVDAHGDLKIAPEATLRTIRSSFSAEPLETGAPLICTPGRHHPELYGWLAIEQGSTFRVEGQVGLPGYHILYTDSGDRRLVLAAPEYLPQPRRTWGWAVQLYAARSRDSWGIGDFRDLALIARLAADQGAGVLLVSPVHAVAPDADPQPSPYSPASRQWLNLLHVAPGDAPGAERVDLSDLAAAGRALNADRRIHRAKAGALKRQGLERIFDAVKHDLPLEYTRFAARHGQSLDRFATWCAIAESQPSTDWRTWPEELRDPESAVVEAFAAAHADRVLFYSWAQWVADLQYGAACRSGVDVVADLAVGFDSSSADAWAFQRHVSFEFEVGCPPDIHNPEGQCWGLPPFNPRALVQADFAPFVDMVRAGLRHAGALRIDHVMQLWRLFWVPRAGTAHDGVYVHYPVDALLAILRIEANRVGAWVVGEDMGTVAPGVRETMAAIGMLGNRSAVRNSPHEFPECSLGTSSTHDQVTVAGLLTRSDAADMRRIGKAADFAHIKRTRRALAELAHLDPDGPVGPAEVHTGVLAQYRQVASAPSRVVVATLDDAAGVAERPNMPGTVDTYPNWRIALPRPVEDILTAPLAGDLVEVLGAGRS
jgi:4-alpha-glucanotransferase